MSIPITRIIDLLVVSEACGQHGNYGFALAAHPGGPQGRPNNGSGSQPMVTSACPHSRASSAPQPGWSHHIADDRQSVKAPAIIMPDNGQVERMNRTLKEAIVKRYYYETHGQLRSHLSDFVTAYNFGRRLKTLKDLSPYEYICGIWKKRARPLHPRSNPSNAGT